jgi:hypothetical protein
MTQAARVGHPKFKQKSHEGDMESNALKSPLSIPDAAGDGNPTQTANPDETGCGTRLDLKVAVGWMNGWGIADAPDAHP